MTHTTPPQPSRPKQRRLWDDLMAAPAGGERQAFARYCLGQLDLVRQGVIDKGTAAAVITEAYMLNRFDDSDQMEEIMHAALGLEVPANMNEQDWEKLVGLIKTLASEVL